MRQIEKVVILITMLVIGLNASENKHHIHAGFDSLSGDTKADFGINLGYSYIMGDNWKYGIGTNIIIANGDKETGDTFVADIRVGKEIYKNTTFYGFIGGAAMNTGYKNSSNDDEIADGFIYGFLCNYSISKSVDLQMSYKIYDLEYGQNKDYDVNSASFALVYKF